MPIRIRQAIRPMSTTLVLTCLIWIYADQINSDSIEEWVTLQVAPKSGSDLLVELQEPSTGQLRVQFSGPRGELERFRRELGSDKFKPVYYVDPVEVKDEAPLLKDSTEIISSFLRKDYKGIAVQSAAPGQVKIFVDRQITVKMPVRVTTGTTKTTTPVVNPGEVNVTLSRTTYQSLYDIDKFIVLDIENELRNKPEDRAIDEEFTLPQLVMGQPVTTVPNRVKVQLRVQQQFKIRAVEISRIEPLGPCELFNKYGVEIRDPQVTVELKGPAEVMSNLKPQGIVAYIRLDQEDMLRSWTTYFPRDVHLILPEGVKLNTDKMSRPPSVLFKLVEKPTEEPPPR